MATEASSPTVIYLLYDANSKLLYVGVTERGFNRLSQHFHHQPWWGQVASTRFEHYATRAEALAREAQLIESEGPLHNIQRPLGSSMVVRKIKTIRAWFEWSQADLAKELGVAPNTVARWEAGIRQPGGPAEKLLQQYWERIKGESVAA